MKIRDLFPSQPQTFSFEFFPPKTPQDVEDLFARARELQPLGPSFISVTYGAGGTTRRNTIDLVCRFQEELGLIAMAHLTCVGHSQAELREILAELRARGIDNVMCLRGDPPRGQSNFVPAPDGFAYGAELVTLARSLGDFCIGVAGYPEAHPESADKQRDLEHLHAKVACGADFVTTQLFFDNRDYFDFCEPRPPSWYYDASHPWHYAYHQLSPDRPLCHHVRRHHSPGAASAFRTRSG